MARSSSNIPTGYACRRLRSSYMGPALGPAWLLFTNCGRKDNISNSLFTINNNDNVSDKSNRGRSRVFHQFGLQLLNFEGALCFAKFPLRKCALFALDRFRSLIHFDFKIFAPFSVLFYRSILFSFNRTEGITRILGSPSPFVPLTGSLLRIAWRVAPGL